MTPDYEPLRALFRDAGFTFVEPGIIHDSSVFVDLAGEDLRRRLYLTSDVDGAELALRPDYTIPVCLRHLTQASPSRRADYAYLGPVFRQRGAVPGEFLQAGVESLGRADKLRADADILRLAMAATDRLNIRRRIVTIGDSAPFHALLKALEISEPWRRRLTRAFGDEALLSTAIERARRGARPPASRDPLRGAARAAVRKAAQDMLDASGLGTVEGRQADEIARRYVEKEALRRGIGTRAANVVLKYLAIRATPDKALTAMRALARRHRIDIAPATDRFEKRIAALEAARIDIDGIRFAAGFGRRLDYYTGFGFEVHGSGPGGAPVIGGGRYDRLMSMLGAERTVPAIGFAIWLERTGGSR
ncbi:MAG: ATP phosphoribosyltransferase regulatory subunit [Alphaproteobacteria bacterium]